MHDIIHDFAQYLRSGRTEAVRLNKTTCGACDPLINPSMISTVNEFCSFSFSNSHDVPQIICNCHKRLRVFELQRFPKGMENLIHLRWLKVDGKELSYEDLIIIFKLYNLQTLSLNKCELKEIPSEIAGLIHLRDLDLDLCDHLEKLPESISSLKELQTLSVVLCTTLSKLPEGMRTLKHLHITCAFNLKQLPQGLAQQTGLRTLDVLLAGGNGLNKLALLKNLNLLTGELLLKIRLLSDDYLEDAVNDAREAELREKMHLNEILIEFEVGDENDKISPSLWLGIIEALQPHPNLKSLSIGDYGGHELPSWIAAPALLHLRSIVFRNCDIPSLPPLGKLACLEIIMIFDMDRLQFIGREFLGITTTDGGEVAAASTAFPVLKILTLVGCDGLEKWEDITAEEEESAHLVLMPCLRELTIFSCPKLTELPRRLLNKMTSLEKLDLDDTTSTLREWWSEVGQSAGKSIFQNTQVEVTFHTTD